MSDRMTVSDVSKFVNVNKNINNQLESLGKHLIIKPNESRNFEVISL